MMEKRKITKLPGFSETLGRLLRVSKAELDAEERKYQAMRKRLRDKQARQGKSGR